MSLKTFSNVQGPDQLLEPNPKGPKALIIMYLG